MKRWPLFFALFLTTAGFSDEVCDPSESSDSSDELCYVTCPSHYPYRWNCIDYCPQQDPYRYWRTFRDPNWHFPHFFHFWPDALFYGSIEAGYQKFRTPSFNVGTITNLVTFDPFEPLSIDTDYPSGGYATILLGLQLPFFWTRQRWGDLPSIEFRGSIFSARQKTEESTFLIPGGLFVIFPDVTDPLNGDTIAFAGGETLENFTQRDYNGLGVDIRFKADYACWTGKRLFVVEPFVAVGYYKFVQKYAASTTGIVGVETVAFDEVVKTNYYDFGGGLSFFGPLCGFSYGLTAGIYGSCGNSDLSVNETVFVLGIPAVSRDLNVHKTRWSAKFKGSAEIGYRFKRVFLSVIGNGEYWGYMPQIINPQLPTSEATHLERFSTWNYSVGLKVSAPLLRKF